MYFLIRPDGKAEIPHVAKFEWLVRRQFLESKRLHTKTATVKAHPYNQLVVLAYAATMNQESLALSKRTQPETVGRVSSIQLVDLLENHFLGRQGINFCMAL